MTTKATLYVIVSVQPREVAGEIISYTLKLRGATIADIPQAQSGGGTSAPSLDFSNPDNSQYQPLNP